MPCWYYEKKDLQNTPSFKEGVSQETEARYRKEGARFIIDAGTKMGLRYDTCATGVVYFHRFYMFHSFKEFPRYVTASCCLFLAGKVEETPKKCKDLIKHTRSMLSDVHFATFKDDPKEEVMTLERILLQTIKFDLMVEHPYAFLLKFAKLIRGDKAKIEKLVQMSWTFINDSLCTTLSLQWEPEVIAVALMYLTSRLNKHEIVDWHGKPLGYRNKWYEFFVEDVTLDLLEDICHQVLDLYSKPSTQKGSESPASSQTKKSVSDASVSKTSKSPEQLKKSIPKVSHVSSFSSSDNTESKSEPMQSISYIPNSVCEGASIQYAQKATNAYIPAQMHSSFMSSEGSSSIQSLMVGEKLEQSYPSASQHSAQQTKVIYQEVSQPPALTSRPHLSAPSITYSQLQPPSQVPPTYATLQQPIFISHPTYKEQTVTDTNTYVIGDYNNSQASYTYTSQPQIIQQQYVNNPPQQIIAASQHITYVTQQPTNYVQYQQAGQLPPAPTYYAPPPTAQTPVRILHVPIQQQQQQPNYQQYDNSHQSRQNNWY